MLDARTLKNPIWRRSDDLRDPAVMRIQDGYVLFYSRFSNRDWSREENWAVAAAFTKDFKTFELDRDITPKGYASPGDPVFWHGRWILPYQNYPKAPARLFYSALRGEPDDQRWAAPEPFLAQANGVAWNHQRGPSTRRSLPTPTDSTASSRGPTTGKRRGRTSSVRP